MIVLRFMINKGMKYQIKSLKDLQLINNYYKNVKKNNLTKVCNKHFNNKMDKQLKINLLCIMYQMM